ncbi:uncharacterized protein LOC133725699 isoform X1 [Rosa rugosa]|uniref:uncharacterized protein LOC133725699 isoform X1 n=1 Tax=Rosa rugosa TaxID=74645 RepID=UPI002B41195C|nr:uncharacterized protein LOC133725699 isoform X1 [Rosa rugosa]XP_062009037.1 uncharacterized protein LOC133725699 isoform X1 [Rosa rugosa]XP_062009038.1 uncharacterized protein LOC133725699 isoform X1 [Rosa rugosa]
MMLMKSGGGAAMAVPCRPPMCSAMASNINSENLRAQLGHLHSEAETTRDKANNARLRLLRLSEAAEKLRRQAAINVQSGREDDAREMLYQKKKVMQALEKSKKRIELLDELSVKLNEAISVKERQLIGNVALDLEVVRQDVFSPVRIVSPTPEDAQDLDEVEELVPKGSKLTDDQENLFLTENQASLPVEPEGDDVRKPLKTGVWNEDDILSSLQGITSFENFLEHLDNKLNKIEAELVTVLRISTLVVDNHEKAKNFKVQQIMELIESVGGIRQRISSIKLADVEVR